MVLGAGAALAGFADAASAGSDSPTPYTVDESGVTLPAGVVFPAHGHVNLTTSQGGKGVHFDPNNGHPGAAWIGAGFIPWSAFGLVGCDSVSWVQVHGFDEHYGEGGQPAVVVAPCGAPEPTETPVPERTVEPTPTVVPTTNSSGIPNGSELAETGAADGIFWLLGICTVILGGLLVAIRAVAAGSKPRYKRGA